MKRERKTTCLFNYFNALHNISIFIIHAYSFFNFNLKLFPSRPASSRRFFSFKLILSDLFISIGWKSFSIHSTISFCCVFLCVGFIIFFFKFLMFLEGMSGKTRKKLFINRHLKLYTTLWKSFSYRKLHIFIRNCRCSLSMIIISHDDVLNAENLLDNGWGNESNTEGILNLLFSFICNKSQLCDILVLFYYYFMTVCLFVCFYFCLCAFKQNINLDQTLPKTKLLGFNFLLRESVAHGLCQFIP